ncbi:MAG TPA: cysteine methyltransferase [Opitutae bacterium]|nr:cysteine methyltransferase [Opitutae bacterium]
MASINDNLFTISKQQVVNIDVGCRIMTRWGPIQAHFSEKGLSHLYFDHSTHNEITGETIIRDAFLDWLSHFESLSADKRFELLDLQGTAFQQSVWRALLEIPFGKTVSYNYIAGEIGKPKANRAVGTAVGANPITVLIPCHRVLQASGAVGNYRWGADRKLALLDAEQEAGSDLLRLFK